MLRSVVASLALVGVLAGCSTYSGPDTVASVNDADLSTELLDDLTSLLGEQAASAEGTGVNADAARNLIANWIQVEVVVQHLDEIGVEVTDADRDDAATTIDADPTLADISDGARDYLVEAQAAINVFNELPDPQASFEEGVLASDIFIKARYGFFDEQLGVLPLGLPVGQVGF